MSAAALIRSIQSKASVSEAKHAQRFFKTGKGEYGYVHKEESPYKPETRLIRVIARINPKFAPAIAPKNL